ncbi:hypothetical protein [Streptomyces katrae]|uniref:hypothetical protein n=1 Tax=Streptomyces katrae TaxID=68223 RepID=UPI000A6BF574|nr:hypothetical protein [Streptomyces katrae]
MRLHFTTAVLPAPSDSGVIHDTAALLIGAEMADDIGTLPLPGTAHIVGTDFGFSR